MCDVLAKGKTFGSATTFASVSVGDSRVYRISAEGVWEQISRDHTLLNTLIDQGEADSETEYASIYGMLDGCLVADDEETDFPVCCAEAKISSRRFNFGLYRWCPRHLGCRKIGKINEASDISLDAAKHLAKSHSHTGCA